MGKSFDKIAVVGLGCLFPGAGSPDAFWRNLMAGTTAIADATAEQMGADPDVFYDPTGKSPDASIYRRGGFIHNFDFDATGYRLPAEYLAGLGNPFRWALVAARQALAGSGYLDRADVLARTGLILGNLSFPTTSSARAFASVYREMVQTGLGRLLGRDVTLPESAGPHHADNLLSPGYPAAVTAWALGLGAGHTAIDAACASSLYAVALAGTMLQARKADVMLAGAVSAADPLFVQLGFTHMNAYPSPGARSQPLDAESNGLTHGEGAAIFALKRLSDAQRDGDTIHAVISGMGISNDGRGKHVLTPNIKGQVLAFERAYGDGTDAANVQYVECHASGTPLGDRTELNSMEQFFAARGAHPRIGSVKSNVGHLLTVAGAASMLKVILSMQHGTIPATVGVQTPLSSQRGTFSGEQIVSQASEWPGDAADRLAGVNAFGFGGVSAHLALQPAAGAGPQSESERLDPVPLAITGMDAHFGSLDGLDALARAFYDGAPAFRPLPEERWKGLQHHPDLLKRFGLEAGRAPDGAYIDGFELDFLRYKIPPTPDDAPIPQQLLLLKVADRAAHDAGLSEGSNVAVIVALGGELALHEYRGRAELGWQIEAAIDDAGLDLTLEQRAELITIARNSLLPPAQVNHYASYIGNIAASRVSSLWDFSGPAFTVSSEENSTFRALEMAQLLLAADSVDAVIVGAVDLAGSLESVLMRAGRGPVDYGPARAGFDRESTGWQVGEGAGAIVLTRADRAPADRAYATLDALSLVSSGPGVPDANSIADAATQALNAAGATPGTVGYVELHASGIPAEDDAEIAGLTRVYRGAEPVTAIGTAKALVGHTANASGMASIIRAALALAYRFVPAIPAWSGPELPDRWEGTPFWAATRSRTWFDDERRAAVSSMGADGVAAHAVLSSVAESARSSAYLAGGMPILLPLAAPDPDTLLHHMDEAARALDAGEDPTRLADEAYAAFADRLHGGGGKYRVALVGRDGAELRREIDRARKGVPAALQNDSDWSTPAGSTFTARPAGDSGGVAFVYPGAFNSYPRLGYDLFHLFPDTYDALRVVKHDVGEAVAEWRLYPRTLEKPGPKVTNALKTALANDPIAMVESGLSFALVYTRIMRDTFGLKPSSAFGYSLGEGSMMWGLGVWTDGDAGSAALHQSPLFTTRIAGPMDAVRAGWGIPAGTDASEFWGAYFIAAPVENVRQAVEAASRVYITHINTPNECMIAGDPAACQRVLEAVGGESMRAPFSVAIHNEAMLSEFGEFYKLHDLPVNAAAGTGITLFSAADYAPLRLDRDVIANSIARMTCKPVDFPRLIEGAYAAGARVFVELGPRSTCARWVDETLGERPHVAASIDNLGVDDRASLVRLLARLVAHHTPLNLSPLYRPLEHDHDANGRSLVRMVKLGGSDVVEAIAAAQIPGLTGGQSAPVQPSAPKPAPAPQPASMPELEVTPMRETTTLAGATAAHKTFLDSRREALRHLGDLIEMQMQEAGSMPSQAEPATPAAPPPAPKPALTVPPPNPAPAPSAVQGIAPLYDENKVVSFAIGRVADTFGERYTIYDNVRAPRIPNGDLLLLSRIVAITGERYKSQPGTQIVTEYDVPADAWFYRENPYPVMPYVVYMEIALQPCGFLSAHHGPTLEFPDIDFYFRNLDGVGTLHHDRDMRGRTITNKVTMTGSTVMAGIIIQKFDFALYDGDVLFYEGNSSFGYFTREALNSQAGLDAGKQAPRWRDTDAFNPSAAIGIDPDSDFGHGFLKLGRGHLRLADEIMVVPGGGAHGQGYAYAATRIDPNDWFFANHFHQDPVMPGSIGVETIVQAMRAYAIEMGLADGFANPRFAQVDGGHTVNWKYRGQILSDSDQAHVEANIKQIERAPGHITLIADASLWRDRLRIYEVKDIAVRIVEA